MVTNKLASTSQRTVNPSSFGARVCDSQTEQGGRSSCHVFPVLQREKPQNNTSVADIRRWKWSSVLKESFFFLLCSSYHRR